MTHGEPLAYAADALAVAVTGVANIAERRTLWLRPAAKRGLPPFLAPAPGLRLPPPRLGCARLRRMHA